MHTITLPPLALQILRDVPRRADRDHVFGDRGEAGFTGWAALRRRLNARLGSQVQPWQLRDLRRTAATGMANIGIQPHIIEEILNHREHRTGVAAVYNRSSYSVECRTALLRWSDHIAALVEGRATRVIAFERPGA
jgi:integrase